LGGRQRRAGHARAPGYQGEQAIIHRSSGGEPCRE
jgi:hypothetical protein